MIVPYLTLRLLPIGLMVSTIIAHEMRLDLNRSSRSDRS
jgi:hypothetical protein